MKVRSVLAPLVSGSTYLRGVHLLLGGVLLLPYVLLGVAFAQLFTSPTPWGLSLLLLVVTAVIAGAPAFLRATRALEIAAARALLGVELPDPAAHPPALETRLRCALWFATHLAAGGALGFVALAVLPVALAFLIARLGVGGEQLAELRFGPLEGGDTGLLSLIGLGLVIGIVYVVAGLGRLAVIMAPVLLGPSTAERIAALESEAEQLAERNRLARELHDSIGHALTITTLQAEAAREVLDSDPEFVRRALDAVAETGRTAMADLDHVLGLLRDADRTGRAPARSLSDLDRLVSDARAAGAEVTVEVDGDISGVPTVVSREGYRIVQECLTNAARHASGHPVSIQLTATGTALTIDVVNPTSRAAPGPGSGRGLAGMRERVDLLGGQLSAGPSQTGSGPAEAEVTPVWRVLVRLPISGRRLPDAAAAGGGRIRSSRAAESTRGEDGLS